MVAYVSPLIAEWIKVRTEQRRGSSSIVIGDCILDAWQRDTEADLRALATDPVRQSVFITVALDALLTHRPVPDLREEVVAANHRRLERLGLVSPSPDIGGYHR